ncbi:MAG: hypothetical protein HY814_11200 [Candidatus Riflebacteria bacterium]|nr:hypothetical protein [Candidatus Riflebacteria bacterium]
MRILVLIKHVADPTQMGVSRSTGALFEKSKRVLNPADEHALEMAASLKATTGAEVVCLTLGPAAAVDALRRGYAFGADVAYHVVAELDENNAFARARALAEAVRSIEASRGPIDLMLAGTASPMFSAGETAVRVAAQLDWPQVLRVKALRLVGNQVEAVRLSGDQESTVPLTLPCLAAIDPTANRPRIPNAMLVMKAFKKEVTSLTLEGLGLPLERLVPAAALRLVRTYMPE